MRNRALVLLGVVALTGVPMALVDCGGGSGGDTSGFDSGTPIGTTVDSGSGTVGDDQGDATAPGITVTTGNNNGTSDGGGGGVDCDATPLACVPQVCGDGVIEPGETCDDGNMTGADGCSASCQLEGDYYACVADQPCVDTRNCDELVEAGVIKDGSDSGCSAPVKVPVCGDGFLDPGEACDTGADVGTPASGCAADCSTAFQGYVCPTAGKDCTNTWVCGDGKIEGSEQCDEGSANTTAGCVACVKTAGWTCTIPGVPCVAARCGDGIVAGSEQCDIGTTKQPGCNTTTCQLQSVTTTVNPGTDGKTQPSSTTVNYTCAYAKPNPGYETCTATVCGNGSIEGSEQCDDGNTKAYDGCSPTCQVEPDCHNNKDAKGNAIQDGTCVAVCGDGLLFNFDADSSGSNDEECDDGNKISGDGCSSTCTVEKGYACTPTPQPAPAYVDVPVVYRDMLYSTKTYQGKGDSKALVYGHPDFENNALNNGFIPDLTLVALGGPLGGIPVFGWNGTGKDPFNTASTVTYKGGLTSASDFSDWFQDIVNPDGLTGANALTQTRGVRIDGQYVRMTQHGSNYIFDSNCDAPYGYGTYSTDGLYTCTAAAPPKGTVLGGFFPIDGEGWFGAPYNLTQPDGHNFSFTTQFRYYFTFDPTASATLTFTGDDDVYVYMNGQRVVDIGGVHGAMPGTYTLDKNQKLGMVAGHVYEVDLFNAERHTNASNFRLALTGFTKSTSVCGPVCGDGFRTSNELCDNGTPPTLDPTGTNTNDGSYDSCTLTCTLGPYCGDSKTTTPQESCDNGINQTPYATSAANAAATCAPGCVTPAYCGDDKVQGSYGELCDNGTANSDTAYGGCTTKCALGPRCGDKTVQTSNGEVCDNGFNATPYVTTLAADSCAPGCKLPAYCGNNTVDVPYEICDNGANNSNTGAYDSCTTSCKQGPHCGDGVVQSPQEQCDDGNQRSGDGCSAGCQTEGGGIR